MQNDSNITLFTIGCPQCKMVKMLLDKKKINYTICDNMEKMQALGIKQVPVLKVNDKLLKGKEITDYIKNEAI